jgi:hypothetical protein
MEERVKQVFSSGGGTQSTAIAALIVQGKLPKPDFVVIADTGREAPSTWEYMYAVVAPELAKIGLQVQRISKDEYGCNWGKGIFATSGHLMLPAFSDQTGEPSKLSGFCSSAWKVEVSDRWLRKLHGLKASHCVKWIGFSLDESKRVHRMMQGEDYKRGLIRFPLVELRLKRQDAIREVERMGWPTPPRSRCWMCPNQSDREWHEVKTQWPDKFQEAIELDESIRLRDPHAFLHNSIAPLKDANIDPHDDLFSASCPSGVCFV